MIIEHGELVPFEVKDTLREREDVWVLKGWCATFHDVDRVNDAIQPGAFAKCLDRMKSKGESLQLYLNHDLQVPIGSIESVGEDKKGLRYEAHLPKDDTFVAGRVVPQIKWRSLKANSFGYKVQRSERAQIRRRPSAPRDRHLRDLGGRHTGEPGRRDRVVVKSFNPGELDSLRYVSQRLRRGAAGTQPPHQGRAVNEMSPARGNEVGLPLARRLFAAERGRLSFAGRPLLRKEGALLECERPACLAGWLGVIEGSLKHL